MDNNSQENLTRANIKEKKVTNSMVSNMEGQYNILKQKISDLEKNNDEMKNLYKNEQERLTKTNSLIYSQTDEGRIQYIKELESLSFNIRKDCEKLQSLIKEKKLFFQFLSSVITPTTFSSMYFFINSSYFTLKANNPFDSSSKIFNINSLNDSFLSNFSTSFSIFLLIAI